MKFQTHSRTPKRRKLGRILVSSYENCIPECGSREHLFLGSSANSRSALTLKGFVLRKNMPGNLLSGSLKIPLSATIDISVQHMNHSAVPSDSSDILLCSGTDSVSTGNKKDSIGSAFRGRRGSHAKVDKTWLLQTKYIMNDLYSANVLESKQRNAVKNQSVGYAQSSSISKEFSFVRKCKKNLLQQHPLKKNVVVASSCDFLPNNLNGYSFHELHFYDQIENNRTALLRSDDTMGQSLILKVALRSTINEDFHYADRAKISKKGKVLDRDTFALYAVGTNVHCVPTQVIVHLRQCTNNDKFVQHSARLRICRKPI